uniref:WH2 domain-containing protein n=1 Tax=Heterorhabditis bacteriophora TaxID=37862 RepID=A0A1I7XPG3_HETBA
MHLSLVSVDVEQEEAVFRILEATKLFIQTADDVCNKVATRASEFEAKYIQVKERAERSNTSVVLQAPSYFPSEEYSPSLGLFSSVNDVKEPSVFVPQSAPRKVVDMKQELDERRQFFSPNQLMSKKAGDICDKGRSIPVRISSIADLFIYGSDKLVYDGVNGINLNQGSGKKSIIIMPRQVWNNFICHILNIAKNQYFLMLENRKEKEEGFPLDETAIGVAKSSSDPLAYRPEMAPIEDLDLPNILPDLPGIAEDVSFVDFSIPPSQFPDNIKDDSVSKYDILTSLVPEPLISVIKEVTSSPQVQADASQIIPPAPPSFLTSTEPLPQSLIEQLSTPVPPPPPPPPPLPLLQVSSPTKPSPTTPDRSDLMAAIRAVGGASKAQLKNIGMEKRRLKKANESLNETSALSKAASSSSGDLISSLTKALEARRKGIYGFALYIAAYCLLVFYILWAFVPTPVLNSLGNKFSLNTIINSLFYNNCFSHYSCCILQVTFNILLRSVIVVSEIQRRLAEFDKRSKIENENKYSVDSIIAENMIQSDHSRYSKVLKKREVEKEAQIKHTEFEQRVLEFPFAKSHVANFNTTEDCENNPVVDTNDAEPLQCDRGFYVEGNTYVDEYIAGSTYDIPEGEMTE